MTGPIVFGTASGNNKTSNYISAGGGYSTGSGLYGLKLLALNQSDAQMGLGADLTGLSYECCLSTGRANDSTASYITFATHNSGASTYKQLGYFQASGAANPTVTFNVNGSVCENGVALSNKYAPINHATTATTYGVGDENKYGHVILYPAASCTSFTSDSGGAVTPAAAKKAVTLFTNDYAPTKTGGGASGTWNINITGNAAKDGSGNVITSKYVTVDTNQSISGTKTFTKGMQVSGRYQDSGDDEGIVIGMANNGYAGLCLGNPSGKRSVFYMQTSGAPYWRYHDGTNGPWNITHPSKSGTIALTSDLIWGNITEKPDTYTPSVHEHTYVMYSDTRSSEQSPDDLQKGLTVHLKANGTDGISDGGNYHGVLSVKQWGDYSGGPYWQTTVSGNGNMFYRVSSAGTTWNGWKQVFTTSGGTITGNLTVSKTGARTIATNGTNSVWFGINEGGTNWGIYDATNAKYVIACNGTKVHSGYPIYGAVWNDYAEFRNQTEKVEPGYCATCGKDGKLRKANKRLQYCEGIVSDTFGFSIGSTDKCKTPLAVSGRVLAYYAGDIEDYDIGDAVCANYDGKITKMTREEIREYPERILGTVSEIPTYETWGDGKVSTKNRIWIKVK